MGWTRIDDKFLMNPKVQTVGVHGMALYLAGLIYCNSNLTDGFIANSMLPMICGMAYQTPAKRNADRLVDANLWEKVDGGYQIHDFLTFNKSKQEINELNQKRADYGAKGGRKPNQNANQDANQDAKQTGSDLSIKQPPINPNTLIPLSPNTQIEKTAAVAFSGKNAEIYRAFEAIGPITDRTKTELDMAVDQYTPNWVSDAIAEGVR